MRRFWGKQQWPREASEPPSAHQTNRNPQPATTKKVPSLTNPLIHQPKIQPEYPETSTGGCGNLLRWPELELFDVQPDTWVGQVETINDRPCRKLAVVVSRCGHRPERPAAERITCQDSPGVFPKRLWFAALSDSSPRLGFWRNARPHREWPVVCFSDTRQGTPP